jgi:hypothetical protein
MKWLVLILMNMQNIDDPRQVLIFYRPAAGEIYLQQVKEFDQHKVGLGERDIQLKKFKVDTVKATVIADYKIDSNQDFTLILIGRDGGEKFRSNKFVKSEELFAIIDVMPMRRAEMKKGKSVGN